MFDHVGLNVRDYAASKAFYEGALGYGTATHVAFTCADRAAVDAVYAAALEAGGAANGPPGLRDYHPDYYAAFVHDPDGNNVEAVCHRG